MTTHDLYENNKRALAKTITFRVLTIVTDLIVVFALTRQYDVTLGIVVISNLIRTVTYFFHERVWARKEWGKTRPNHATPAA
jgi:uncharacterized membrane protein